MPPAQQPNSPNNNPAPRPGALPTIGAVPTQGSLPSPAQPANPGGIQVVGPPVAPHQSTYHRPPQLQPISTTKSDADSAAASQGDKSSSPYDFFLEDNKPQKRPGLPGAGGPMSGFTKMLIAAGGLVAILGILAVILSASRGNQNAPGTGLTGIAQTQQEIIRVNTLASPDLISQSLDDFSATAIAATTTAQQQLIEFTAKNGAGIDTKQLDLTKNTQTDAALTAAKAASTFDSAFRTAMRQLLTDYQAKTQAAYDSATTDAAREILDKDLTSAKLLLQMLNAGDTSITPTPAL